MHKKINQLQQISSKEISYSIAKAALFAVHGNYDDAAALVLGQDRITSETNKKAKKATKMVVATSPEKPKRVLRSSRSSELC